MKILYILNSVSTTGGATKSFVTMLHQVLNLGNEALVVCPSKEGIYDYLKTINGVKVEAIKYRSANYPLNRDFGDKIKWLPRMAYTLLCNYYAIIKLLKLAKEWTPDLIHENTSVTNVGYWTAKILGIPYVMHIREYGDKDFGLKLYDVSHRLSDSRVYTIPITYDIAKYRNVVNSKRNFQIYNGIIKEKDIRYTSQKLNYFLFAGRIELAKGIDDLLEAYSLYYKKVDTPMPLRIAGASYDKHYLNELKNKSEQLNIAHMVEWLGSQDNMEDLYYKARATIVPSLFEGLGRVMPEAMANGCLCIGRDTGGTHEQFNEGKGATGQEIGFRFNNVQELANLMITVSDSITNGNSAFEKNGIFYNIIMASQEAIRVNFTVDAFTKKLMKAYLSILLHEDARH